MTRWLRLAALVRSGRILSLGTELRRLSTPIIPQMPSRPSKAKGTDTDTQPLKGSGLHAITGPQGVTIDREFTVDGTLLEAWASAKSFRPKDGSSEPPGEGRKGERDFHGEQRECDRRRRQRCALSTANLRQRRKPSAPSFGLPKLRPRSNLVAAALR